MGKYIKLHSDFKRMQDYYQNEIRNLQEIVINKKCDGRCGKIFEPFYPDFLAEQSQLKSESMKKVKENEGDITVLVGSG